LYKGRTKAVPGEGPARAKVMIIGEAPGRQEDLSGEPFVGRAGKVLDDAIKAAGFLRGDVFVTNVVKCRPPRNRPPSRLEAETCKDAYLLSQVELISPRLVVLLGRTAVKALLAVDSLGQVRGSLVRKGGTDYLCTYHPAAILRNPRLRPTFDDDLLKLRRYL
jgi:uracil-DNA glycosylase